MHRAILEACFPYFLWLLAALGCLWLVIRVSGARLSLARLRTLHRAQEGSVQTLSFVLTLPLFMMILLFIVQVSQLMIGITIVHYAAFAAARAASVWLPADMSPNEPANSVGPSGQALPGWVPPPSWQTPVLNYGSTNNFPSWKCQKVWTAAVMACYPIAPSKPYLNPAAMQSLNSSRAQTTIMAYQTLVPGAAGNPKIPTRILNKAAYAAEHTSIQISGTDYDNFTQTYNPIGHPNPSDPLSPEYYFPDRWQFKPNEIGWQDPITVQVWFRFPLMTGPGRFLSPGHFLSARLSPPDGTPDKVSSRIQVWRTSDHPNYRENLYWTQLTATATVTSEGLISIIPHVQQPENIN